MAGEGRGGNEKTPFRFLAGRALGEEERKKFPPFL